MELLLVQARVEQGHHLVACDGLVTSECEFPCVLVMKTSYTLLGLYQLEQMLIGPVGGILNVGEFLDRRNPVYEIPPRPVRLVVVGHDVQGDDGHQQDRAEWSSETSEGRLETSPF